MALEGIHDVHSRDRLTTGMLRVDDILEEDLEDTACLPVNKTGDALHAATTSETADVWLGDALDVVTKDLAVAIGASLS